jgi:hypothetical protein
MKNRTLRLNREVLTELSTDELDLVVGGSHLCGVTDACTHGASFDNCPTIPLNACSLDLTCIVIATPPPTLLCR